MEVILYWAEVVMSLAILVFVIMSFAGTYRDFKDAQRLESNADTRGCSLTVIADAASRRAAAHHLKEYEQRRAA